MRFHLGKTKISKIIHNLTLFIVHKERTKPLKKTISKKIPQTKYMFQHLYIISVYHYMYIINSYQISEVQRSTSYSK